MKTIVLIDDDVDEYLICSEVMEMLALPITCTFFNDTTAALAKLRTQMPDFVFIDMIMPRLNGIELMQIIKELPEADKTKFVILSTFIDDKSAAKAMAAGATACLQKKDTVANMTEMMRGFFSNYEL